MFGVYQAPVLNGGKFSALGGPRSPIVPGLEVLILTERINPRDGKARHRSAAGGILTFDWSGQTITPLTSCDLFVIPSTSHWTFAAIIVAQANPCIATQSRTSAGPISLLFGGVIYEMMEAAFGWNSLPV